MQYLGTITVPSGTRIRNNRSTGCATLDLGTKAAGHLDTKIRMYLGGAFGNSWTIAVTGDSAAGAGVSIVVSPTAKTIVIHYESLVSTVALVEAAIAALANSKLALDNNANLVFAVDAAGTGATVLNAATDNITASSFAGGAAGAFVIPPLTKRIRIIFDANAAGYNMRLGAAQYIVEATSNDTNPGPSVAFELPLAFGIENVLSLRSTSSGTVAVHALDGQTSS